MMMMNSVKSSMMMAAIATMAFAAGCTDEPAKPPAQKLLDVAKDGNKRIDDLIARHQVLTTQIVSQTLAPIDKASDAFNAELISWQDTPAATDVQLREIDLYRQAGIEISNLSAKLDAQGFAFGPKTVETCETTETADGATAATDCGCDDVVLPEDPGEEPTPIDTKPIDTTLTPADRVVSADDSIVGAVTETVYWKRVGCKTLCTAGQAAMVAACQPIIETVIPYLACVALAVAWGESCKAACDAKFPGKACF